MLKSYYRIFEILKKYNHNGRFDYSQMDDLKSVCNAPIDKSGVYILIVCKTDTSEILYIGCSGKKKNGVIVHRKGGIKARLVNGKQFGDIRKRSWSKKMKECGLSKISVFWYDTEEDDPKEVERQLLTMGGTLPSWNKQRPRCRSNF